MNSLLKYLAIVLFVALVGAWFFQAFKSCNANKVSDSNNNTGDNTKDVTLGVNGNDDADSEETANLDDLYDEEEEMDEILAEAEKDADLLDEYEEDSGITDDSETTTADDAEATYTSSEDEDEDEATTSTDEVNTSSSGSGSGGNYLVVAGAFISKNGAERTVNKLSRLGYDDAEMVKFDYSEYHSVCVDRFYDEASANALARELKRKGVEAYVHKKRKYKKKS